MISDVLKLASVLAILIVNHRERKFYSLMSNEWTDESAKPSYKATD